MSASGLKIGLFSFCHPSDRSVGGANVVSNLSVQFRELGHEVWVYYPVREPHLPGPELWNGIHAVPLHIKNRVRGPLGLEKEISKKMAHALHRDLDVVVANNEFGAFFDDVPRDGSSRARRPLKVVALHGLAIRFMELGRYSRTPDLRNRLGYWLDVWALRPLERRSLESADVLVACSDRVRDDARETYGVAPERVHVVYNGVNVEELPTSEDKQRAREALGLSQAGALVAFVGGDPYRKGLDLAKASVRMLRGRGTAVTLLNVGNSSPSEEGMVSFGKVLEERKRAVLLSSDIFVLPSIYEGFPAVIQEAATLGIPVVTSFQSGLDIGKPGRDYVLVSENTADAYAASMGELLEDRERLARIGEAGKRVLGSRSYRDQARDYIRLFESIPLSL
jgi:glycosyltransferase involved in cell wall biosynthesis